MAAAKRKDNKGRNLRQGESQRADGRYMYRYTDVNGSRKTIYSMDLAELRDMEKEIERNLEDGISTDTKTTLNDMYHKYMESKTELKATTKGNYAYMYEHFVMNTSLGKKQVAKIKYSDVKAYYNSLVKQGLSANTIGNVHTIIHPILTLAVRDGYIRSNPSDGVMAEVKKSHGFEKTQRHALTVPQQERFIDFLNTSDMFGHWKNLITVFLGTGCRVSEIIGLRWDDVDLKNNIISINHNCVYQLHGEGRSEFHITTPKTSAGCREIPMLSEVKKALLDERRIQFMTGGQNKAVVLDEQGNEYKNFIFSNRFNSVFIPTTINRAIKRIVDACNEQEQEQAKKEHREAVIVPYFSVHQLRHTFCTRFCENETNVKVIQEIMGHKDIQTTMNIYAEATREKKQQTMEHLEGKFKIS